MEKLDFKNGYIKLLGLLMLLGFYNVQAEGTKELWPVATNDCFLQINRDNSASGLSCPFAVWSTGFTPAAGLVTADYRLNVTICEIGEKIYMGFKDNSGAGKFTQVRLIAPSGTVVFSSAIPKVNGTAGYASTRAKTIAGPKDILGVVGGYDNFPAHTTTEKGDYYLEFNYNSNTTYSSTEIEIEHIDVTVTAGVATPSTADIKTGRLWSKNWQFNHKIGFHAHMFIYSDDGIVTELDPNDLRAFEFQLSCNATGCVNTGNGGADRRSRAGQFTYPQYKIFLNDPDINCYPTGQFGQLVSATTITGCGGTRCVNITVDQPGNILVLLDLNGVAGYQPGTSDLQIAADVVVGANCVPWNGLDGLGNTIATGTVIPVQVDFLNGLTNFPLYDGETNPEGFKVSLVRPTVPGFSVKIFWDDDALTTGSNFDGSSNYTGCTNAGGCHIWNGRGNNSCPPCAETLNTWWYANIVTEVVSYTYTDAITDANASTPGRGLAGNAVTSCATSTYALNGSVINATGGTWTRIGGSTTGISGLSANGLTGTFTPQAADLTAGSVILLLTSIGTGPCPAYTDSIRITFQSVPALNIGSDTSVCRNNPTINLIAVINTIPSGVQWTGGTIASYTPSTTTLNGFYNPTQAELSAGSLILTATTTGNGACAAVVRSKTITFTTPPVVFAGNDQSLCSDQTSLTLGTATNSAGTPAWTTLGSGTFGSTSTVNTTYSPSPSDKTNGSVRLILSSSLAGCNTVRDTMLLTIPAAPTANAGNYAALCKNNNVLTLAGTASNHTSVTWSSTSGTFSDTSSLTSTFTPSATQLTTNSATLTLTAKTAGCNNAVSTTTISYTDAPTVAAGSDIVVCRNNLCGNLSASFTGATGVTWTGGSGTYTPNANTSSITYCFSAGESALSVLTFIVTTTGNGNCIAVRDTVSIGVTAAQTANAGVDMQVCENNPIVTLAGSHTGSSISWSSVTANPGAFSNTSSLTSTYTLTPAQITAGTVVLRLTSNRPPFCAPVTDDMIITVIPAPIVDAGVDQSGVCYSPGTVNLNGTSSTGSGTWSGGAGTFTPNALSSSYQATLIERNAGTVTLTLTSTNNGLCNAVANDVTINFAAPHTIEAGPSVTTCANNPDALLSGTNTSTAGSLWSGGTGSFAPNATVLNPTYTPSAAEITAGSVKLYLTTTLTGGCTPVRDSMIVTIPPAPILSINGGAANVQVCANNPGAAMTVTGVPVGNGVIWSGGSGTFSPSNTATSVTYTPSAAEIAAGSVVITVTNTNTNPCVPVSDNITVLIAPTPIVNAGTDQVLCGNTASVTLGGSVTNATGGDWTITSGSGSFSSTTSMTATYTPSANDKTAGLVTLTLTSTGNGTCTAVTDQMNITFTAVPTINAGPNQSICSNNFPIQLSGTGSAANWTGGAGTYVASSATLNAQYTPDAGEIGTTVTLTLTTIPSGACPVVSDQVQLTIQAAPTVDAGNPFTVCGNSANFTTAASSLNTVGLFWSTLGSGTFSDATFLNPTYTPSAADKTAGSVQLILTSTGNTICNAVDDTVLVTITPTVSVFAGNNLNLCGTLTATNINANVTGATSVNWVSSGTGSFGDAAALSTTYTPTAADVTVGSVTITATTTGVPATCPILSSNFTIAYTAVPTITATNNNPTVCENNAVASLNSTITNTTGMSWTTSGSGAFSSSTSLTPTYTPSLADIAAGSVTFTATANPSGPCPSVTATASLTITPRPTITAGSDITVCANNANTNLSATVTVATGGAWSTTTGGTFSATSGDGLQTTYTPSAADITNGTVSLTVTSTNNGLCNAVSDVMVIIITPAPVPNAGFDRTVCGNNANVILAGTTTVATGGTWSTSGTGTFSGTSANGLSSTYTPSSADTTAGTVTLSLITTGNGLCTPVTDQMVITITDVPFITAGPDITICADSFAVKMNGNYSAQATAAIWTSSSATGSFANPGAFSDTASYIPAFADRPTNGVNRTFTLTYTTTAQGSCLPVSDDMVLTITTAPVVTAGTDQTICSTTSSINVSGTNNGISATTLWASSGTGTFADNTALNTTYTPSAIDIAAGQINITLRTTTNGSCRPSSAFFLLNIIPITTVNLGLDRTVCASAVTSGTALSPVTLTNSSAIVWSTLGTGTFGPNTTSNNVTYFPSSADTLAAFVDVVLTSTGLSPCGNRRDTVRVNFNSIPSAFAGSDNNICTGSNVSLSGAVDNATGGTWTTSGSGTFAPSTSTLNASYIPSAADTTAGSVTLTLTSSGSGACPAVTDQMIVSMTDRPVLSITTTTDSVCISSEAILVNAIYSNATGIQWASASGGGFSPSNTFDSPLYYKNSIDSVNKLITITVQTTSTGVCPEASDNITVRLIDLPSVSTSDDFSICNNAVNFNLGSVFTLANGVEWSTSNGTGSFSSTSVTNPVYTPTAADLLLPSLEFVVVTDNIPVCSPDKDTVVVSITATVTSNAGNNRTVCLTDLPIQLDGSGAAGTWSGGAGIFANANSLNTTYAPSPGEAVNGGSVTLTLTADGTCAGPPDNVVFSFINGPDIDINPLTPICNDINTLSLVGNNTNPGSWSVSGSGTFSDLNNVNSVYTLSAADKLSGQLNFTFTIPSNGTCAVISDTARVLILPQVTATAGTDFTICANALNPVNLGGSFTNATGVTWSRLTAPIGNGSFSNVNSATSTFTPIASDTTLGQIDLQITTTGNGFCTVKTDVMSIFISKAPTDTIGPDSSVCSNKNIPLWTRRTIATGGTWTSSGSGLFSPDANTDNAIYVPSTADTTNGSIVLTYTTTGNGNCAAIVRNRTITFTAVPIVNAGDQSDTICSGNPSYILAGQGVANAASILWTSTGTGSFTPSNTTLNAVYNASALDIANGGVILRIATTGVAECDSVFDFKSILIVPSPVATVNAGQDQTICIDNNSVQLHGLIGGPATQAQWVAMNGTGTFMVNDNDLDAVYTIPASDKAVAPITLRLITTVGNGICPPAFDDMTLNFMPVPVVTVPADITICADSAFVDITGSVTHPTLGVGYSWTTSGSGIISPDAASATIQYVPSANDIRNGRVGMTLTSTGNGTCSAVSASMNITITPKPTINAGSDITTCANVNGTDVVATIRVATGGTWTSSGSGSFNNTSANGLSSTYDPSAADDTAGLVQLRIFSTGNGSCKAVSDTINLTIRPTPIVDAGVGSTLCASTTPINILGTVTNATGGRWSTAGTGSFSDAVNLSSGYVPSGVDTAAGSVKLYLTSTGNGTCIPVEDSVTYTFDKVPTVGTAATTMCRINTGSTLTGSIANAIGGNWTTSGTGTFTPNANDMNAVYIPSNADFNNKGVTLTLTSTGNFTCNAVTNTLFIDIDSVPVANAGPDQFNCVNQPASLNTSFTGNSATLTWRQYNGTTVATTTSYNIASVDKDTAFILTTFDTKLCPSDPDTIHLRVFNMPNSLDLTGTQCLTDSNIIVATPNPGFPPVPGIFSWKKNNAVLSGETVNTIYPFETGTYQASYSWNACVTTSSNFIVNPTPVASGVDQVNCHNNNTTLTMADVNASYTYSWTAGALGSIVSGGNTNTATVNYASVSTNTVDTVAFAVTVTNTFNCSVTDSVYVISIPKPIINLLSDTVCQNTTVLFDGKPTNFGTGTVPSVDSFQVHSYTWLRGTTNLNLNNDSLSTQTPETYYYNISIGQCTSNPDTAHLVVLDNILTSLVDSTKFCEDNDSVAVVTVSVTNVQAGVTYTYSWNPTGATNATLSTTQTGYNVVTVTGTVGNTQCSVQDSVKIKSVCPPKVFVPNVFNPGGDPSDPNSRFQVFGGSFKNFEIIIFNRWGEIIFKSNDKDFSWDGIFRGIEVPLGVYPYLITYDGDSEEYKGPFKIEGEVLIIR